MQKPSGGEQKFLDGHGIFILANGMGKNRLELFRSAVSRHGAKQIEESAIVPIEQTSILVLVDENTMKTYANVHKALEKKKFYLDARKRDDCHVHFVKSQWLSECLKQKQFVDYGNFEIPPENEIRCNNPSQSLANEVISAANALIQNLENNENKTCGISKRRGSSSDEENAVEIQVNKRVRQSDMSSNSSESGEEVGFDNEFFERELKTKTQNLLDNKSWTCAHSSKEASSSYNVHVIKKLEEMSSLYENTKDKFRALSYQKAIAGIKRISRPIQSREEVLAIPGIGKRLADRIWEIVETGNLSKLECMKSRDDIVAIELFTTVHGIGPTTAQNFVAQGFRTLDDLRIKANLTRQQKIGLKYHAEFLQRIPRDEVAKIEQIVKEAALTINSGLIVETCGSYRRGKPTCGDVDILVTHPDGHSHKNIFGKIIEKLHEIGFLTDDLVVQDESSDSHRKYLGVCKLPEDNSLHRRLDIIVVPYDEYACALVYFTGSAHFNRSMRRLAQKIGLSLTEKSLNKNVIRKGAEKINDGERLATLTEEDVFKYLSIPFRKPEERDF